MRIILLKGDDNVGKSTVLNAVHTELVFYSGVYSTPKRELGNPVNKDFECIVTLKDKRQIAFFTMGDMEKDLEDGVEKYSYLNCEVLIIAINSMHDKLLSRLELKYPNNVVEKSQPFKTDRSQWKDVGTVLSLI